MTLSDQANGAFTGRSLPCSLFGERDTRLIESQQKRDSKVLPMFYIGSIIFMLLCSLSCIAALYRNTILMEENFALLKRQIEMQSIKCSSMQPPPPLLNRIRREVKDECPPCEVSPPVHPYKNPVSVLNEDPRVGLKANYEVLLVCKNPPKSRAVLTIKDDPAFAGKEWIGTGSTKQNAKQSAAWNAIENEFPELKSQVGEEYIPELYNPPCSGRNVSLEQEIFIEDYQQM